LGQLGRAAYASGRIGDCIDAEKILISALVATLGRRLFPGRLFPAGAQFLQQPLIAADGDPAEAFHGRASFVRFSFSWLHHPGAPQAYYPGLPLGQARTGWM
jgi:hypothetical protein